MMFTKIENAEVLVRTSSGLKVLPLYTRNSNNHVYAKNGAYYIALMSTKLTSNPKITWQEVSIPEQFEKSYMTYAQTCKESVS
ncbi:hypothetical protein pEaSNUABM50_00393 [Erwinia phage pEa_SNUABM_50]|uniref:Uncharacterized protein n=4 Tax=Eneladusvirus BF TaxID=2560751 RepID=A0A7L8ZN35_9CAUD|nr:hypothetical protein FDH34_gp527 [Serratia phage BF]QOI71332.1 hypothetical protein pEaSNUABM12_00399 [Erwinia phage pEa_SNUABM_12]QOI71874.1 hypothetical protein pEaSNUABM47_00395 [Erwinia phage pEa_SNUABM_47]QOI72413.1 hypothetical protein pEaSNUABM50_00393 [Erwinia phage pEa_SNUABM_50]QXO11540.1 hypothetical protein pEaSNUABM19_00399 [Erwinia phage pEa_SNUABM_19]QXO12088.1 hypothetical protein pEaSNUABM44_00397 [Erwinia phage pEa_SNUABM_44]QXO12641.1 hypothetical protein pEaSNUABM49_004